MFSTARMQLSSFNPSSPHYWRRTMRLIDSASESDLVWLSFNGETLRIAGCGATVIVPAIGTAWDARYAIKATQLDHLPKRLANPVVIGVWEERLTIGRQVWNLVESEILLETESAMKIGAIDGGLVPKPPRCHSERDAKESPGQAGASSWSRKNTPRGTL